MGSSLVLVLTGLILLLIHKNSECYKIDVTPDPGTIVTFSKKPGQVVDCSVCKGEGQTQTCNSALKLTEPQTTTVNFNCSQPGDIFNVEINQDMTDCTATTCRIDAIHPGSTRFRDFTRTFTWDVKVPSSNAFQLDFPAPGMRQINPSERCPDKHTYNIIAYPRLGTLPIGMFCRNGTISRVQVMWRGRVSLEVPKGTDLNPSDFKVSSGPEAKALVEVDTKLHREQPSINFFTPNYATGLFNEEKMKWNFAVEPVDNFTVHFLDHTAPQCQTNAVSVDYMLGGKTLPPKTLTDDQPANSQGDFSLTLSNCNAKKGPNLSGLSLNFNVSVFRGGIPYLCMLDLRNAEGLSIQIENKKPESVCEMRMNSVVQKKIDVPAGTKAELSFLDCPVEDLQLTATKTIAVVIKTLFLSGLKQLCSQRVVLVHVSLNANEEPVSLNINTEQVHVRITSLIKRSKTKDTFISRFTICGQNGAGRECLSGSPCAMSGTDLTIPMLESCLPVPLHQFTWLIRVPDPGTVDLISPQGNLHQSVPDQECNERVSLLVSESDGSNIGQFCSAFSKGAIQKIQIKANVSITAMAKGAKDLSQEKGPFLKVFSSPEISENIIYYVLPSASVPTYIATPNWPDGMKPSASVSWIVDVPQQNRAELQFPNVSQPKCSEGHTAVKVDQQDSQGGSWREDQTLPNLVTQYQRFYLNMSNCEPENGHFAVISKITLQKETRKFLGIILAVVGVLLLLLIIALIAVCVIKRKKKPTGSRSSIFMPKGTPFLPGNATFPKTRADNESHTYASIEDTMMYGHLLNKDDTDGGNGTWSNGHQVDTYRQFTGPTDSTPMVTDNYSTDRGGGGGGGGNRDAYQGFLNPSETFIPPRPRTPLLSQGSIGFEDRRMIDNEFNTFKSFGDINTIRLSADESKLQLEPEPEPDSDSDSFPEYEEAM